MKVDSDYIIVGNGIIGLMTAYFLIENNEKNIKVIGPFNRSGSATKAAGAMLNVVSEIDGNLDEYSKQKLSWGKQSLKIWPSIIKKLEHFSKDNIESCKHMVIYSSQNMSGCEKESFDLIKKDLLANKKKFDKKINVNIRNKNTPKLFIDNEGGVDTAKLLLILENYLKSKGVVFINDTIESFNKNADANYVELKNSLKILSCKKLILCTGAFQSSIKNNLTSKILSTFYGVGCALKIKNSYSSLYKNRSKDEIVIIRTPNRGGTCGLHIVPLSDKKNIYVGATHYLDHKTIKFPKFGSFSYLTKTIMEDISLDFENCDTEYIFGYRPVSLDGKIIIGEIEKNIFVLTGTRRDGLTLSPIICAELVKNILTNEIDPEFSEFKPDRQPISFGNRSHSCHIFALNRAYGILQHFSSYKKIDLDQEYERAYNFALKAHENYNLKDDYGIFPDLISQYFYKNI